MKFVEKPQKLTIVLAAEWKYKLASKVVKHREKGVSLRESINLAVKEERENIPREEIGSIIRAFSKNPEIFTLYIERGLEEKYLREAAVFIAKELGVSKVDILKEEEATGIPVRKLKTALPAKPALIFE
jgi:hypothetical protein